MNPLRNSPVAVLALVCLIGAAAACSTPSGPSPAGSPSPSTPVASSPPSPTSVTTPDQAAALVLASDPRFAGLARQDPNLIGQCCFYTVTPAATGGFSVRIEIGWGDCPAGCIDRHHWRYVVGPDGTVRPDGEDGPPVPAGVPGPGDGTSGGVIGIRGAATAGPVCPVVRPNDPACADRPVVGATIHVLDVTGLEIATLETDQSGAFVVTLPPGQYRVQADAFEGLMRTPAPIDVTVGAGLASVQLVYDTVIR